MWMHVQAVGFDEEAAETVAHQHDPSVRRQ
jgi:hypothetical protein